MVERGRLACVDYLSPKPSRPGGVRFLFDCGTFAQDAFDAVVLQQAEIEDLRLASLEEALGLLSGPLRRRISQCAGRDDCVYLEDGRPVSGSGLAQVCRSRGRSYVESTAVDASNIRRVEVVGGSTPG